MQFNLIQNSEGAVVGTYTSSLGGGGRINGILADEVLAFELTQSLQGCPGIFKGTATVVPSSASVEVRQWYGTYTGTDCLGDHGNGNFTMNRGTVPGRPSPPATPPTPTPPTQAKVEVVVGQVSELRGVKYVFVSADQNPAAQNEIAQRVAEVGLRTLTDARQAELGLYFGVQYSSQGDLIVADVVGQAFRPNSPTGLRRVWAFNHRIVKRSSMTEKDITRDFLKAFLDAYRAANH